MYTLTEILRETREIAKGSLETLPSAPSLENVDIRDEFGTLLEAKAKELRDTSLKLSEDNSNPVEVIQTVYRHSLDAENLAVRFRKVDLEKSDDLRSKALDVQFSQPDGLIQILRNISAGVYEGGNGGSCLPAVVRAVEAICDVYEKIGETVAASTTSS